MKYLLPFMLLLGCTTPNVWVQSKGEASGSIGYQNYDPKSDNGAQISNLIPCRNYVMTWNGLKSQSEAPMYLTNSYGISTPITDGSTTWMEFHYRCR